MNIYQGLGVRPIINAKGPATRLSGGTMSAEVTAAMAEAAQACVDIADLQGRASEIIAEITGAEAGYVTSGAAAGLLLGTAACVAGLDPGRMSRLPDTTGMKNEVVMVRSQRNFYDHAVRTAGVKIVEVGLPDRYAGAGVRDAENWEIADAINDRTAAVFYVADRQARPALRDVVQTAHAAGVPVLVDAAAQLPPTRNLRRFIEEGVDLVAFSGGKAIGGPQGSGILCGKRDLIMSAALQQLDLDIYWEQWQPPANLIDKARLKGVPQHGIGRPCKVGKETIAGLLTALQAFVAEGDATRHRRWLASAREIAEGLHGLNGVAVTLTGETGTDEVPQVVLTLNGAAGMTALDLVIRLQSGTPGIQADPTDTDRSIVAFNPMCLRAGEAAIVARAVKQLLQK
jgi:D-glucosaminate-6-phosphate ammonia-lyase